MSTRTIALRNTLPVTLGFLFALVLFTIASFTHAAPNCTFDRDLDISIEGDDVLCLQQYLNGAGYTLTTEGPGAPGSETNRFGGLTRDALKKWQADNDISPANGYFGPYTRAVMMADPATPVSAVPLADLTAATTPTCTFDRDLEIGLEGDDVLCLQKYLNAVGFAISSEGPGAPGKETNRFGGLTRDALARWQADKGITPASGYVGPRTRAALLAGMSAGVSTPTTDVPVTPSTPASPAVGSEIEQALAMLPAEDRAQAQELLALFTALGLTSDSGDTESSEEDDENADAFDEEEDDSSTTSLDDTTADLIRDAIRMIRDADEAIDEGDATAEELESARDNYEDARDDLLDAMEAYLDGDTDEAQEAAEDAYDNAEDAFKDAGGVTDEDEAEERFDELEDELDDARDTLEERDDDGDDVSDAEDLLDEAEDLLDEAADLIDDNEYADALDTLDEVEDTIDDALDAVVSGDAADAKEAIADAEDAIDEAYDAIDEARDDGDDVADAEDLLDDAEEALEDAENAYDDDEWDDAIAYAEEAEDYANDAIDEL